MKIEAGKFYRTRDGQKIGPFRVAEGITLAYTGTGDSWHLDGRYYRSCESPFDIIAEWTDEPTSPVRTVTRKEIEPGTYGYVEIGGATSRHADVAVRSAMYSASELRAAAKVFTDLADALDEQGSAS